MSAHIYFETNWIIGAVLGQDLNAENLLSLQPNIQLAIPSVCLMETISAFDWKRIERNRLTSELDRQLAQVQRSKSISAAQQLSTQLIQAKLTNDQLLNELLQRLDDLLVRVAHSAELIPVSSAAVEHMVQLQRETELDRDDALILACILADAKTGADTKRAFLTGNIHDFGAEPVAKLLEESGIKLFASTERILGWANAL